MEPPIITGTDTLYDADHTLRYDIEPNFAFGTEADALSTLQTLAEDLRNARELERQILRYMAAAAKAAHHGTGTDGSVTPGAIIEYSGVARQTVYNWLS